MAWELFDREGTVGLQICGVDGDALEHAPVATLPVACEVTVRAESAAPDALGTTERDLEAVTESLGGRIVATARGRTELVTLAYLPGDDAADRYTTISLPRGASVSVAPALDPGWTLFDRARPVGIETQSMLDFRVRSRLFELGDLGGDRPIEHIVEGLGEDTVDAFMASLSAAFDAVSGEAEAGDVSAWKVTHVADPSRVTESSWMIRQIAERHGARYDGWGCELRAARKAERSKRKRWWSR